jgi:hypothetical protein
MRKRSGEGMETILVMLSGGLDSVYMLYHYLTETRYPLHVHHISLRYPHLNRWRMEDPASREIVDYCRKQYRDFEYSESRFDMEEMNEVGMDSDLHLLVAAKLAPNLIAEKVSLAFGYLCDDDPLVSGPRGVDKVWWALLDRVNNKEKVNRNICEPLIDLQLTKQYVCENLPDDLLRLCWSCRIPDFTNEPVAPCGWCDTCERIEKSFNAIGRNGDFPNLVRSPSLGVCHSKPWEPPEGPDHLEADLSVPSSPGAGQADAMPEPSPSTAPNACPSAEPFTSPTQHAVRVESGRVHSPRFKSQVALAALRNSQSKAQLAERFKLDPDLIDAWMNTVLEKTVMLFEEDKE